MFQSSGNVKPISRISEEIPRGGGVRRIVSWIRADRRSERVRVPLIWPQLRGRRPRERGLRNDGTPAIDEPGDPISPRCDLVAKRKAKGGRGDWIRTSDPLRPRQVRYQAALRPDSDDPQVYCGFSRLARSHASLSWRKLPRNCPKNLFRHIPPDPKPPSVAELQFAHRRTVHLAVFQPLKRSLEQQHMVLFPHGVVG